MKINFLLTVFLLVAISLSGQRVVKKVSAKICDCISEIDYRNLSYEEAEIEYGKCIRVMHDYDEKIKKAGFDLMTDEGMRSFIMKMYVRLSFKCPQYNELFKYVYCEPADTIPANIRDSSICREFIENSRFEMDGPDGKRYILENSNNIQKEINVDDSYITYNEIIWLNNCEYKLKFISTENPYTEAYSLLSDKEAVVNILNIEGDNVTFKIEYNSIFYISKMRKIKENLPIDTGR